MLARPRLPRFMSPSPLPTTDLPVPAAATAATAAAAAAAAAAGGGEDDTEDPRGQSRCVFGPIVVDRSRPLDSACTWGVIGGVWKRSSSSSSSMSSSSKSSSSSISINRRRRMLFGGPPVSAIEGFRHWEAFAAFLAIRGIYPDSPNPNDQIAVCPRVGTASISVGRSLPGGAAAAADAALAAAAAAAAGAGGGAMNTSVDIENGGEESVSLMSYLSFSSSLLTQLSRQLLCIPTTSLIASERCFSVELRGEGAQDLGGPYAEALSTVCDDLISSRLLIPSSNARAGVGEGRDLTAINPMLRDLLVPAAAAAAAAATTATATATAAAAVGEGRLQQQSLAVVSQDDRDLGVYGPSYLNTITSPLPSLHSEAPPLLVTTPQLRYAAAATAATTAATAAATAAATGPLTQLLSQVQHQQIDYLMLLESVLEGDEEDCESLILRFWGQSGLTVYGQLVARSLQAKKYLLQIQLHPQEKELQQQQVLLLLLQQQQQQQQMQQLQQEKMKKKQEKKLLLLYKCCCSVGLTLMIR
ncbi:MGC83258 protein, related, related [Eimeria praecox]|uniref:MGC83258 protein, related, related n=1 Tax=Eimeria praecox TaxID=51316 RepID=U6GYL1_9EIME|nr:MGC83258 protein, related, related [Eimeria praecox]